jgi:hypothetical protein
MNLLQRLFDLPSDIVIETTEHTSTRRAIDHVDTLTHLSINCFLMEAAYDKSTADSFGSSDGGGFADPRRLTG